MLDKIVLVVRLQIKAGKKAQFLTHLKGVLQTMSAEPNFINSIVHHNLDRPDEVIVYETWLGTRETWLRDEYPRPYRQPYEAILNELVDDRSVDWLVPVEN
jgi:Antibiotic biosynthesis monooxygenase